MSDADNNPPPLPPGPPAEFGSVPPLPPPPPRALAFESVGNGGNGTPPPMNAGGGAGSGDKPPGMVTAMGIMVVVGGAMDIVLNLFWALYFLIVGLATFGVGLLCCVVPIVGLVSGTLSLIHGIKMLQNPDVPPSQPLAIAQVCSIFWCGMITVVCGILTLVFTKNPEVVAWYDRSR